jgi:RNA polymerase sigma-70 factor (ECF subfamily)
MVDAQTTPEVADLVAQYHEVAYRYAYRLTGSVHDAEDLTQDVFLIAQRKIGQLRNTENPKAWLLAILRNSFLKSVRRQRPTLAVDSSQDMNLIQAPCKGGDGDAEQIQDALDRLPEASRLVLVMFYFEECSYREIAERLEMPIGTVMSRLARAKEYLRALLEEPEKGLAVPEMGATGPQQGSAELGHGRHKRPVRLAARRR